MIAYPSMMSAACRNGLPELCGDDGCENWEHAPDVEPFDMTAEQDDASWLAEDCRAKRLADR